MTSGAIDASGRVHRRYRKATLVWYCAIDPNSSAEPAEGIGSGFDISRTGLGLTAPKPIPLGARLLVHVRCREFEVTAVTKVVRLRMVDPTLYEVGLHFVAVSPDQRALMGRVFP
jgi:hypothetical protein